MPRSAIHPGEHLAEELREIGVTAEDVARDIGLEPVAIERVIAGSRDLDADLALRLGHWFGTSAQFWLNLQTTHDLRRAEQRLGAEIARLPTRRSA